MIIDGASILKAKALNVAIARKSRLSEGRAKFTWTMPSMSEFDEVKGRQIITVTDNGAFRQCEDLFERSDIKKSSRTFDGPSLH